MAPGGGGEDHRPAEPDQEPQAAREVGGHVRHVAPPGDVRFDRELGQGLKPGQEGQGQALAHEELRDFRGPGDHEGREQDRGERPKRRQGRRRYLPRAGGGGQGDMTGTAQHGVDSLLRENESS